MSKPRVLKAGTDPDCVHHEYVDPYLIGRCYRCGQMRAYGAVEFFTDGDVISDFQTPARKAASARGGHGNLGKPSPKKGIPADSGLARDRTPGLNRRTMLPVLTRGAQF